MSFQNNNAADAYQDFMLPTALDSDFSSEDLADDMEGLQLTMQRVKIPAAEICSLRFAATTRTTPTMSASSSA